MSIIANRGLINVNISSPSPYLPDGVVLLDYFKEGFRFGVQPDVDIFKQVYDLNCSELNLAQGLEGDTIPYGFFDADSTVGNTWGQPYSQYDFSDVADDTNGFTVEYYIKIDNALGLGWVNDNLLLLLNNNTALKIMYSYTNSFLLGYSNTFGSWSWNNEASIGDSIWQRWNHIAITKKDNTASVFVNGIKRITVTNVIKGINKLKISTNTYNSNSGGYESSHRITQLCLWNYVKYNEDFTPSSKPILN